MGTGRITPAGPLITDVKFSVSLATVAPSFHRRIGNLPFSSSVPNVTAAAPDWAQLVSATRPSATTVPAHVAPSAK